MPDLFLPRRTFNLGSRVDFFPHRHRNQKSVGVLLALITVGTRASSLAKKRIKKFQELDMAQ